jgi:hypothetical protein
MRHIRLVALWIAVVSGAATASYSSPIDLASRSVLVGQIGFPTSNIVEQFTLTGSHSNSLLLGFSGLAESLAVLDGALFVSDSGGTVRRIDPISGNVVSSFSTGTVGLSGLGTFGSNLLTLSFNSNQINVYSPVGALQTSIRLATTPPGFTWNGVTSDGQSLFLADFASGRIYNYSLLGSQIGFFQTGLLGVSGVAYDAATNSLWVANSPLADTANRGAYRFSTAGALLGSFSTPTVAPNAGIAVTGSVVPEPTSLLLTGTALGGLAARVRWRRTRGSGSCR